MKKVISFIIISTLAGTIPQVTNILTSNLISHSVTDKSNNLEKLNDNKSQEINFLENYFNSKNIQAITEIKQNLLNSISLKNDVIIINKNILNQKILNHNVYKRIISSEYLESLNWFYQNNLLLFTNSGNVKSIDSMFINLKSAPAWLESKWYWFGYCKLHISSDIIHQLGDNTVDIADIAKELLEVPDLNVIAVSLVVLLKLYYIELARRDNGNGAYFGFIAPIIFVPLDFGSN